jgi:hypothetical protein
MHLDSWGGGQDMKTMRLGWGIWLGLLDPGHEIFFFLSGSDIWYSVVCVKGVMKQKSKKRAAIPTRVVERKASLQLRSSTRCTRPRVSGPLFHATRTHTHLHNVPTTHQARRPAHASCVPPPAFPRDNSPHHRYVILAQALGLESGRVEPRSRAVGHAMAQLERTSERAGG